MKNKFYEYLKKSLQCVCIILCKPLGSPPLSYIRITVLMLNISFLKRMRPQFIVFHTQLNVGCPWWLLVGKKILVL